MRCAENDASHKRRDARKDQYATWEKSYFVFARRLSPVLCPVRRTWIWVIKLAFTLTISDTCAYDRESVHSRVLLASLLLPLEARTGYCIDVDQYHASGISISLHLGTQSSARAAAVPSIWSIQRPHSLPHAKVQTLRMQWPNQRFRNRLAQGHLSHTGNAVIHITFFGTCSVLAVSRMVSGRRGHHEMRRNTPLGK